MADKITPQQRRKNMQAIHSTSNLEDFVAKELWKKNIRYRRNVKNLYGRPDIAIKKYKLVIFIDSCFWHNCVLQDLSTQYCKEKVHTFAPEIFL